MPLHRLTTPLYIGGLPGTHDEINNLTSGTASLAGGVKVGGDNAGTFFVAFAEDGTSENANRPHRALAENTDFLDDVISGQLSVPDSVDDTAAGPVATRTVVGSIYIGVSGTAQTQDETDNLAKVVDSVTGNEIIDASGVRVKVTEIRDSGDVANRVGASLSLTDFETDPVFHFTPSIPSGTTYRILHARRSKLSDVIATTVDSDALTRNAIRGGHQASAEVFRFMQEISRRLSGGVAAVAATIFETPGLGAAPKPIAKANRITMDVDPDDAIGNDGQFNVRFDRDGTPATMFRVHEGTGGDSRWRNVFERIAFEDTNIGGVGFGESVIPLTGSTVGAEMPRLFETDPGFPLSIVQRLNSASWTVVCGNGTTTFGDYNGATALTDAVAAAIAAGVLTIHITLKAGTYTVDDLTFTGMTNVVIEGAGGAVISNGATAPDAGININTDVLVSLRNLTFEDSGATSVVPIRVTDARLQMSECDVADGTLEIVGPAVASTSQLFPFVIHCQRCSFNNAANVVDEPLITMRSPNASTHTLKGFVWEDCVFFSSEAPVLRAEDLGTSVSSWRGVLFNRCEITLRETTVNAGDVDNNSGVFELVDSTAGLMRITDIEWRDCNVTVDLLGAGDTRILMLAISDFSGNYIAVDRLTIRGGVWTAPTTSNTLTPFYIGSDSALVSSGFGTIIIEDVDMGYGTRAGATTAEWDYGAVHAFQSFLSAGGGSAIILHAETNIRIKNLHFPERSDLPRNGEIMISSFRYEVDGIDISVAPATTGAGFGTPQHRVFIKNFAGVDGVVSNIEVIDGDVTLGGISLQPDGGLRVENCASSTIGGSGGHGFFLVPGSGGPSGEQDGLSMFRCTASGCAGDGFHFIQPNAAFENLDELIIDNCKFVFNTGWGVRVATDNGSNEGINSCSITNCYIVSNTAGGILVASDVWPSSIGGEGLVITDNSCFNNGGIGSAIQIQISQAGATDTSSDAAGVIQGNRCGAFTGTRGQIHMFGASATIVAMHGIETGWTVSGTPTSLTVFADFLHVDLDLMVQNMARYTE